MQHLERDVQAQAPRRAPGRPSRWRPRPELAQQPEAQRFDARGRHQRLRGIDVDVGARGAQQRQVRARLGIVDVVGEELLPAFGRGDAPRPPPRPAPPAGAPLRGGWSRRRRGLQRREQPACRARARPARSARSRNAAGCGGRRGGRRGDSAARRRRRQSRPRAAPDRPPPADARAIGPWRPAAPSLDLQPQRLGVPDDLDDVAVHEIAAGADEVAVDAHRDVAVRTQTRAPPANVSDRPSAPGNSGASATASAPTSARSERSRPPLPSSRTVSLAGREPQRGAAAEADLARAAQGQRGVDPRAADADAAARAGVLDDRSPSAPARSRACRRDTAGSRSGTSTRAIAAEARGQQRDAAPGPAGRAHVDSPPRDQAGARCGPAGRCAVAASWHAGLRQQRPPRRARRGARRRSAASRSAGGRRPPPGGSVERCSSRASAASIRSRSPSAPHAFAARGFRRPGPRKRARRAGGRRLPQQRGGAAERPAFELGQRRPAAAGGQRLRGGDAARAAQLVCLAPRRPACIAVGLAVLFPGPAPASASASSRGGVEIGQRYVGDVLLAGADRAEQRRSGLPSSAHGTGGRPARRSRGRRESSSSGSSVRPSGTHPRDATV